MVILLNEKNGAQTWCVLGPTETNWLNLRENQSSLSYFDAGYKEASLLDAQVNGHSLISLLLARFSIEDYRSTLLCGTYLFLSNQKTICHCLRLEQLSTVTCIDDT